MPHVSINTPSPKVTISPIQRRSYTDDISGVAGVAAVVPGGEGPTYTADVTGGAPAAIQAALTVPSDWTLSVT